MRSDLFSHTGSRTGPGTFALQNPPMLEVDLRGQGLMCVQPCELRPGPQA